jgi:hypothetical protein
MIFRIEIKNRWTDKVLFELETENNTIKKTVTTAVESGANLRNADLTGSDLIEANLMGADLVGANLRSADLVGANLTAADLRASDLTAADLTDTNLTSANLKAANLTDSNLTDSNLTGTNFIGADLRGTNFIGADLIGANLKGANLTPIKYDMFALLIYAKSEIANLKKSIIEGKIDGSTYEGECACLCGTLEKTTNETIEKKIFDLRDSNRPIERFFMGIKKGDTPETNQLSKIALEWVKEFETLIA